MSDYTLGMILGIVVVLVLAIAVYKVMRKKTGGVKYDERQMMGRGKAFQAGFFTSLITGAAVAIADYTGILPGEVFLWHMAGMMVSIAVFALTAIHFDAYVGMTDTPKRFLRMGGLLMAAMVLCAAGNLFAHHEENYVIAYVDLMLAGVWALIIVALLIHNRAKAEDEE